MSISISNIRCFQSVGMILQLPSRRRPGKQFLVCGGMTKECEAKGGRPSGAGDSNTEVDRVSRAGRWLKETYGIMWINFKRRDYWTCDRGVVAARQVPPHFTRVFLLSYRLVFSIPSQTSHHASRTRVNLVPIFQQAAANDCVIVQNLVNFSYPRGHSHSKHAFTSRALLLKF